MAINVIVIVLYFVLDVAEIALFVTPEFNTTWKFISLIIPWVIIYFTAPRTGNGYKITVSIWGAILVLYYIYNGNVQIRGNEYMHAIAGVNLVTSELRANMIIAIILSCLAFVSGLGIFYRAKEKNKSNSLEKTTNEQKIIEYVYYDENGNISETPTNHKVRK